jgi:hypothetical protein
MHRSRSRGQCVVGADVVGEALLALAERGRGRGKPGQHDVEEIGAAAEHAAGRVHPGLDHLAPADQVVDGVRLDKRQSGSLATPGRDEAHPFDQRRSCCRS